MSRESRRPYEPTAIFMIIALWLTIVLSSLPVGLPSTCWLQTFYKLTKNNNMRRYHSFWEQKAQFPRMMILMDSQKSLALYCQSTENVRDTM